MNKTSNNYNNGTYNVIKHNSLFDFTDNISFTKKSCNTSNITNNIKRHDHNNYEQNVNNSS